MILLFVLSDLDVWP